jgi:uncharacterized protein (DUF58 family)
MKRFSILFCILVLGTTMLYGQTGPKLSFSKEVIEVGTHYLDELEVIEAEVEFTNTGDQPLVLTAARGCCGTRVMDWPREPINPGESGLVSLQFKPRSNTHKIRRTLTLTSNDPDTTSIIRITGEVVEGKSPDQ